MSGRAWSGGILLLIALSAGCAAPTSDAVLSSANELISFSVDGDPAVGVIDETAHTGTITLKAGADLASRTIRLAGSPGSRISPASGSSVTFTVTQAWTPPSVSVKVTAEDGTKQKYVLSARRVATLQTGSILNDSSKATADQTGLTLVFEVPSGTDVTQVYPTWVLSDTDAIVSPGTGSELNLTSPVEVTVTSGDGLTKTVYTVSVTFD